MDVSCNMVNITPVEGETSESLAVLRSGKATAEEKGKEVAGPDNSGNNPVPSPSPNKPDEEGRKSQKVLPAEYFFPLVRYSALVLPVVQKGVKLRTRKKA